MYLFIYAPFYIINAFWWLSFLRQSSLPAIGDGCGAAEIDQSIQIQGTKAFWLWYLTILWYPKSDVHVWSFQDFEICCFLNICTFLRCACVLLKHLPLSWLGTCTTHLKQWWINVLSFYISIIYIHIISMLYLRICIDLYLHLNHWEPLASQETGLVAVDSGARLLSAQHIVSSIISSGSWVIISS